MAEGKPPSTVSWSILQHIIKKIYQYFRPVFKETVN